MVVMSSWYQNCPYHPGNDIRAVPLPAPLPPTQLRYDLDFFEDAVSPAAESRRSHCCWPSSSSLSLSSYRRSLPGVRPFVCPPLCRDACLLPSMADILEQRARRRKRAAMAYQDFCLPAKASPPQYVIPSPIASRHAAPNAAPNAADCYYYPLPPSGRVAKDSPLSATTYVAKQTPFYSRVIADEPSIKTVKGTMPFSEFERLNQMNGWTYRY